MRGLVTLLVIGLWAVVDTPLPAADQVPELQADNPRASFALMAEYLARSGGRWRSANPDHDGSPSSAPEFGLWFEQELNGRILRLRIVLHYADSTVVSSEGQWAWHPGLNELRYLMIGRGGSVTEGTTVFSDARTFTTVATLHRFRGSSEHRDDNVLVSADLHRNETFDRSAAGEWVSRGVYEWRREPG